MKQIKPESLLSVNLKVIKRHPFFFLAAMVSAFLLQFTAGLFPAFIEKQMFSFFENKIDLPLGVWFIIILMATGFLFTAFAYITMNIGWLFRTKIKKLFVSKMLRAIILQPKEFDTSEAIGETAYKFREDIDQLSSLLTGTFPHFSTSLVIAIVTVVLMFSVNVTFTFIALFLIALNIGIITLLLPKVERRRENSLKAAAATSGFLTAALQSTQEIKTDYKNQNFIDAYFNINQKAAKAALQENIGSSLIKSLFRLGHQLITSAMLIFIALNIETISFSVGDLAFFISLSVSLSNFASSVSDFFVSVKQTKISLERVQDIYTKAENEDEQLDVKSPQEYNIGSIVVKNLCVEYPESNFKIEKSFEFHGGEYYFIFGAVASGKSSVIKSMLGITKKAGGEIILNGKIIENPESIFVSPLAVYVPPTPQIFNASLRENILLGVSSEIEVNITEAEIQKVLKITRLDKDLETMPKGLETKIGNLTGGVSGGQTQRIGIARALLCKSKLVVLDDCFTAVDSGLAGEIRKDIAALDDLTVIEISNRKPNLEMIPQIKQLEF
ncbi:ABC transporter ATP-binding protein [Treponema sp. OMZ 799]|uniref:ATP-binding cassette domain-containing protein n=1 Tax=Treponema sp. OMZ 799 TaxID=2563668 RepID=UPI0020A351A1|nr:ABC transporter ATP-binding protein [Treponema sp. OMZ 799]UTC78029.1 ABC transporter ATP-binding protein [Treponema sp. OMZ 799]